MAILNRQLAIQRETPLEATQKPYKGLYRPKTGKTTQEKEIS